MREITADLDRWQSEGEEIALATLVGMRGSAPRLPGARLGLTRSGKMTGSISGGCVESDVFERALEVLDQGVPAIASYGIADELGFEVGLSCGGRIEVLIEPFRPSEPWQALRLAVDAEQPAALAIALAPDALLGRTLVVVRDGSPIGQVEPGVDETVVAEARGLMREGGTRRLTLPGADGERQIFVQAFAPPARLFIVGATHTAIPLARMAGEVGFHTTVIDARGAFATPERFPDVDEIVRAWPDEVLAGANLDAYSYVVLLTHDPKFDGPALGVLRRTDVRYIGAMSSRTTHARRVARLRAEGWSEAELSRIRAPVGLDLGGRAPEEIAVAILAEMLAVRHGRDGGPLSAPR